MTFAGIKFPFADVGSERQPKQTVSGSGHLELFVPWQPTLAKFRMKPR